VRNYGSDLQVCHSQPAQPWHNAGHNAGWKPELATATNDRDDLEKLVERDQPPPGRTIFGLSIPTFILSCILFVVTAGLVVVGGLLGYKVANLESTIPALANTNNNNNNTTNPPINRPAAGATIAATAPYQPTLPVAGWDYLGCYYDTDGRIMGPRDAEVWSGGGVTNEACGSWCLTTFSEGTTKPRHFGTQVGQECHCGTLSAEDRANRRAPDWMCNRQCAGRFGQSEVCGGNWVLSLYERQGS
jgi:hypothetical protein